MTRARSHGFGNCASHYMHSLSVLPKPNIPGCIQLCSGTLVPPGRRSIGRVLGD